MIITDFHSHILPALDHGCKDLSEAASQLGLMKSSGTDIAVATPHFYPHVHKVDTYVQKIERAVDLLMSADITVSPQLTVGAEVLLCENLHEMDGLSKLCIQGTRVLLLELPLKELNDNHYDTVESLISDGYTVVLAHIDRYFKSYGNTVDELLSIGALAQINASSLSSHAIQKRVRRYLEKNGTICAIGSDLHGTDKRAYRQFVKSKRILGDEFDRIMSNTNKLLCEANLFKLN